MLRWWTVGGYSVLLLIVGDCDLLLPDFMPVVTYVPVDAATFTVDR